MKSAIGIGALLMDGLGDTIRVSLTEDPEYEIEPCGMLARMGEAACEEQRGVGAFTEEYRCAVVGVGGCVWVCGGGGFLWLRSA